MRKTPRPTEAQLEAWRALLMSSRGLRATLERELQQERHLSLAAYEALLQLWGAPGHRLRMQELAQGAQLSRSGISQLVGRMEAAGLVARGGAADDGRGTVCSLTPEGIRAFKRAAVVHVRGIQEHFAARFTDQEAVELTRLLRHVIGDWPPPDPECSGTGTESELA